jgi:hypothetical protein
VLRQGSVLAVAGRPAEPGGDRRSSGRWPGIGRRRRPPHCHPFMGRPVLDVRHGRVPGLPELDGDHLPLQGRRRRRGHRPLRAAHVTPSPARSSCGKTRSPSVSGAIRRNGCASERGYDFVLPAKHVLMDAFRSSPLSAFAVAALLHAFYLLLLGHRHPRLQAVAHEGLAGVALELLVRRPGRCRPSSSPAGCHLLVGLGVSQGGGGEKRRGRGASLFHQSA